MRSDAMWEHIAAWACSLLVLANRKREICTGFQPMKTSEHMIFVHFAVPPLHSFVYHLPEVANPS